MSFLASRTRSAPEGVGKAIRRAGRSAPRQRRRMLHGRRQPAQPGVRVDGPLAARSRARILRIDAAPALATPGVLAVLTGADLVADGLNAMWHRPVPTNPHDVPLKSPDGAALEQEALLRAIESFVDATEEGGNQMREETARRLLASRSARPTDERDALAGQLRAGLADGQVRPAIAPGHGSGRG